MIQRKIAGLLVLALLAGAVLTTRLFGIAILQHGHYVAEAERLQLVETNVEPQRGSVWLQDAATGHPDLAAQSVESYALSATPKNVAHKAQYAQAIASFAHVDEAALQATFEKNGAYMDPIMHGLSKQQVDQLTAQLNGVERGLNPSYQDVQVNYDQLQGNLLYFIGGVFFIREFQRTYPQGQLASQVLGFVNDKGQGQYGFEDQYDSELSGYGGTAVLEQDSLGTLLGQESAVKAKNGESYELSIDRNVQYTVEQYLAQAVKDDEATGGSAIAMNPKTGEIIALANNPTFDPNHFRDVKPDAIGAFDDAAVTQEWEPGSIFKPLVMSAALDQGLVNDQTSHTFDESVTVQGHKIETALRRSYGTETPAQILANSDNVAMVWIANMLGNQTMYNYLKSYGLGQTTGVDLKNETPGSLKGASQWKDIDRATISFGQGVAVSPLQIITAYAAIANDGRMVQPHIVHAAVDPDGTRHVVQPVFGAQVIKPSTAQDLRNMMVYTIENADKKAAVAGYKIGGKTGTAQIPDPTNGGYVPDAYNHSFVGIFPSDDPQIVLLVKIDHPNLQKTGLFAESTAVPLFQKIASFMLSYYQIPPTNR